jgi:bifunctional non-homologous end joining protein LigD
MAGQDRSALRFAVQAHSARRMHFDLRLELDGALKSWAVPNGFSADPREKRLAVATEDHPLAYLAFEGVIPRGQYGAGEMIVWDRGDFWPEEDRLPPPVSRDEAAARFRQGLASGRLKIHFAGQKLRGSWNLVRTSRGRRDWLLIRRPDGPAPRLGDDRSVVSGLALDEVKAGRKPVPRAGAVEPVPGAKVAPFPSELEPMTATATDRPFSHPDWLFEPKLDGYRLLAFVRDGRVSLRSRRGLDATRDYPCVVEALAAQPGREMVLDGEVVALDEAGRPTFKALQARLEEIRRHRLKSVAMKYPLIYYVFDLLYLDGQDLRGVPLERRKELLCDALATDQAVRVVEHVEAEGELAYQAVIGLGLEGIVAKSRRSLYESGRRSAQWLKVKASQGDEMVVGGFTQGNGARADTIGALLVGQYDDQRRLRWLGHVGTGFDDRAAADLRRRLDALRTEDCPFATPVVPNAPPVWARPELVVEVTYQGHGADGLLRFPVFVRRREDKAASEVQAAELVPPPLAPGDESAVSGAEASTVSPRGPGRRDEGAARAASSPGAASRAKGEGQAEGVPIGDEPRAEPWPDRGLAGNGVPDLPRRVDAVLTQLAARDKKLLLDVDGQRVALTNLDKELWPGLTKRDLITYLSQVAPYVLPHLRDRPLTLIRFPNGIAGERFYHKHFAEGRPDFVETVELHSEHNGGDEELIVCNNLPTLLWLGQVGALELHSWYSRVSAEPDGGRGTTSFAGSLENLRGSLLNFPDYVVFDLDPVRPNHADAPKFDRERFKKVCQAAHWLRELLDGLGLGSFVKTTGRSGLHVFVPIERKLDFDAARAISQTIAQFLRRAHPREITAEFAIQRRTGDVFVDWNQNVRGKTLTSIYSPRATPDATVSMPLRWDEVGRLTPLDLTIRTAPARLREIGDVWASVIDARVDLAGRLGLTG